MGNGIRMNAKCPNRSVQAAATSPAHANFLGIFRIAPMTATTVSQPSMSKAMYQSGPLMSAGKNVEGCAHPRKANPAKILQRALSIHQRSTNTATIVAENAT